MFLRYLIAGGAGTVGGSGEIEEEGARVRSVKPRPRKGRTAGSKEERLLRRPEARSTGERLKVCFCYDKNSFIL